jgi:hypothetical protein
MAFAVIAMALARSKVANNINFFISVTYKILPLTTIGDME